MQQAQLADLVCEVAGPSSIALPPPAYKLCPMGGRATPVSASILHKPTHGHLTQERCTRTFDIAPKRTAVLLKSFISKKGNSPATGHAPGSLSVLQNADTGAAPFPPGALSQCTHLPRQLSAPRWNTRRRLVVIAALKSAVGTGSAEVQSAVVECGTCGSAVTRGPATALPTLFKWRYGGTGAIQHSTIGARQHKKAALHTCL